jgi:hypothetical protein
MMVGRRIPPNRTAKTPPYRFGHSGLAGEPAGLDPARIWLGPARSGLPRRSSFSYSLLNPNLVLCCTLNHFKIDLSPRKL